MDFADFTQYNLRELADNPEWLENQTNLSLKRLMPRLEHHFATYTDANPQEWDIFCRRLAANFSPLFRILVHLYGNQYDFFFHLEELLFILARSWIERPADLKLLDTEREIHPDWFQSNQMLGGVCYVGLFAGDLAGLWKKYPTSKS